MEAVEEHFISAAKKPEATRPIKEWRMFLHRREGTGEYFLYPEAEPKLHLPATLLGEPNFSSGAKKFLEAVAANDKLSGSTKNMEALNDVLSACFNCIKQRK